MKGRSTRRPKRLSQGKEVPIEGAKIRSHLGQVKIEPGLEVRINENQLADRLSRI